jgi:hypothetical protein
VQLKLPVPPLSLFEHGRMVGHVPAQEQARDQLWEAQATNDAVIGGHGRSFRGLPASIRPRHRFA